MQLHVLNSLSVEIITFATCLESVSGVMELILKQISHLMCPCRGRYIFVGKCEINFSSSGNTTFFKAMCASEAIYVFLHILFCWESKKGFPMSSKIGSSSSRFTQRTQCFQQNYSL